MQPAESPEATRSWLVRGLGRVIGVPRAELVAAVLGGLWPFLRILMLISFVWIVAGLLTYYVETFRTVPLEAGIGYPVTRTYRDSSGEVLVDAWTVLDEEGAARLRAAGYRSVRIYNNSMFQDVNDGIWWSIVTMTTVGYGDRYPETKAGRAIAVVLMFTSLVLLSSFTATFASAFVVRRIEEAQRARELTWEGHLILCGWNPMAPRILAELNRAAGEGQLQVIVINGNSEESMELLLRDYEHLEIRHIRGNFAREEDLRRCRLHHAAAALIIPDASEGREPDDVRTIEATVTIKDMAPEVKVFAHVQDMERVPNLRRALVDDVVVTDEFTPQLLVNYALRPGATQALRELLSPGMEVELQVIPIPQQYVGRPVVELSQYLRRQQEATLIALVIEEEGFGLDQAMKGGDPYIVDFIREVIEEAGISTQATGSRTRVMVNPPNDTPVQAGEQVLVIRRVPHRATPPAREGEG